MSTDEDDEDDATAAATAASEGWTWFTATEDLSKVINVSSCSFDRGGSTLGKDAAIKDGDDDADVGEMTFFKKASRGHMAVVVGEEEGKTQSSTASMFCSGEEADDEAEVEGEIAAIISAIVFRLLLSSPLFWFVAIKVDSA